MCAPIRANAVLNVCITIHDPCIVINIYGTRQIFADPIIRNRVFNINSAAAYCRAQRAHNKRLKCVRLTYRAVEKF